jgi:hypothetical protein
MVTARQECIRNCALELTDSLLSCVSNCYSAADWSTPARTSATAPLWQSLMLAAVLLLLSGLFSGLTLGLMVRPPSSTVPCFVRREWERRVRDSINRPPSGPPRARHRGDWGK